MTRHEHTSKRLADRQRCRQQIKRLTGGRLQPRTTQEKPITSEQGFRNDSREPTRTGEMAGGSSMNRLPYDGLDMARKVGVLELRSWERLQPQYVEPESRVLQTSWRDYAFIAVAALIFCLLAIQWGLEIATP